MILYKMQRLFVINLRYQRQDTSSLPKYNTMRTNDSNDYSAISSANYITPDYISVFMLILTRLIIHVHKHQGIS